MPSSTLEAGYCFNDVIFKLNTIFHTRGGLSIKFAWGGITQGEVWRNCAAGSPTQSVWEKPAAQFSPKPSSLQEPGAV